MFGFSALCQTGCVLSNGFLSPKLSSHLQITGTHDKEGDTVGENKVGKIVAETCDILIHIQAPVVDSKHAVDMHADY